MNSTLTPAQQQGFEIGKQYHFIGDGHTYADRGDIVVFDADDGSDCPWFKKVRKAGNCHEIGERLAIDLSDLAPCGQFTTTKQKLSPQELLLLYVKQHYPEDHVMIAMVESL